MKTNESEFEMKEDVEEVENAKATSTSAFNTQLWSTCIRKLIRALAATLLGGTLVYFICRWLIR